MMALPQNANPRIQAIYDRIGRTAFTRMGAGKLRLDNRQNALGWSMKNSRFAAIRVSCLTGCNGYRVCFYVINPTGGVELVIEPVEAGKLVSTLEQMMDAV